MNYLIELKERAEKAGFKMSDICREAGINQSQMSRWIAGRTTPLVSSIDKLRDATDRLIATRAKTLENMGQP